MQQNPYIFKFRKVYNFMSSNQEPKLNNTAKETKKQLAQDKTIDVFGKEKNSETTHNLKVRS